jgi:hypothetical protein
MSFFDPENRIHSQSGGVRCGGCILRQHANASGDGTAGGGAMKTGKTMVLMSIEDGIETMRRASGTGYRPPGS